MSNYLWQNPAWPHFTWQSEQLINPLLELHTNQGILEGQMRVLGFKVRSESTLQRFTQEIQKSFEIEGVQVSDFSLRSSIARKLGLEKVILDNGEQLDSERPKVSSIVEVIIDAVLNCNKPLTQDRLFYCHSKLFGGSAAGQGFNGLYSIRTGQYRTDEEGPMRVISGNGKNEVVHFQAPPAEVLPEQMSIFFKWFNTPDSELGLNSVLKSAIAHLYFVELHPFEDGNGRMARAIADMALCRGNNFNQNAVWTFAEEEPVYGPRVLQDHLFSMSAQLCKERKDYYRMLQQVETSGSMDITQWLLWYVGCMNRAVLSVLSELEQGQKRREFWERVEAFGINDRQRKVLTMLLGDFKGNLTSTKYAKICNCSQDTASRDIEKLIAAGVLQKGEAGGRSTNYLLCEWN